MALAPLEQNKQELLLLIKKDPIKALRMLRQKWDSLMGLASAADKQKLGLPAPYAAFSTFYTGLMTVPSSHTELGAGQYNELLASHVNKYYQLKGQHTQTTRPSSPAPGPGPQEQPNFMPLFIGGLVIAGALFFFGRKPPT